MGTSIENEIKSFKEKKINNFFCKVYLNKTECIKRSYCLIQIIIKRLHFNPSMALLFCFDFTYPQTQRKRVEENYFSASFLSAWFFGLFLVFSTPHSLSLDSLYWSLFFSLNRTIILKMSSKYKRIWIFKTISSNWNWTKWRLICYRSISILHTEKVQKRIESIVWSWKW